LLSRCFRLRVDVDQLEGVDILCETKGTLLVELIALVLREVDTAISVDVNCRPRELETLEPWQAEGYKRLSSIIQIVEIRRNRERLTENLKKNMGNNKLSTSEMQ
jgi:hypothetical protein